MIWIAIAASDSIAAASSSPEGAEPSLARSRRRRDSARAGNDETASNAAARRFPPCPRLRSPADEAGLAFARLADDPVRPPGDLEPLSLVPARVMGIGTHPSIGSPAAGFSDWAKVPTPFVDGVQHLCASKISHPGGA